MTESTTPTQPGGATEVGAFGRVQLALNVADLDAAVDFYRRLLGVGAGQAARRLRELRGGARPPLKLVLIAGGAPGGTLNHLGVEVGSTAEVEAVDARLTDEGLTTAAEQDVSCCYARQDKIWVEDPDGAPWEIYTVLADAPEAAVGEHPPAGCC